MASAQLTVIHALTAYDDALSSQSGRRKRGKARDGSWRRFARNEGFVRQLMAVACGIRCATLVDSAAIQEEQASQLAGCFRLHLPSVAVLFEQTTEQVFLFNRRLLVTRLKRLRDDVDAGHEAVYVEVAGVAQPMMLASPPSSLNAALLRLSSIMSFAGNGEDHFISLELVHSPAEMPPVAAWLLEYGVGYVVQGADDGRNILGGVPLTLVKVIVNQGDGGSFDLLAFSFPSTLAGHGIDIVKLKRDLEERYSRRIQAVSAQGEYGVRPVGPSISNGPHPPFELFPWRAVDVNMTAAVIMDRVAL